MANLYVVDHMCIFPYGHNLNCLVIFKDSLEKKFDSAIALACKKLPDEAEQSGLVERVLYFPYAGIFNLPKFDHIILKKTYQSFQKLRRLLLRLSIRYLKFDFIERQTLKNWHKIFNEFNISSDDLIFFPSAEYYGCVTLLKKVMKMGNKGPKIHIRFIGVCENLRYSDESPQIFNILKDAIANGVHISFSAETPKYCKYLEKILGVSVDYLPYPLANGFSETINWSETFVVSSPGQGRLDKGYNRLKNICYSLQRKNFKNGDFVVDIQSMNPNDQYYDLFYEEQLKSCKNIHLRGHRLSQEQINDVYMNSSIMLLPYDASTYAYRGSAVFQECLATGRLIVAGKGMGFSDLICKYNCGLLCETDEEFAQAIVDLSRLSLDEVRDKTFKSRQLYEDDWNYGLSNIMSKIGK